METSSQSQTSPIETQRFPQEIRKNIGFSFLGIAINLAATFFLMYAGSIPYLWAYLAGTLCNVGVSTALRRCFLKRFMGSLNIAYGKLLAAYIGLAFFNLIFVWLGIDVFRWNAVVVIVGVTLAASAVNFILVGLWAFVYLPIEEVIYESLDGQFFDDMADPEKVGPVRAWLHRCRYRTTYNLVKQYYAPGKKIIDFACGACNWNLDKLPVIGLDVNEDLLKHGLKHGRLSEIRQGDMYRSPFADKSADIIVSSQVFEHLHHPQKALAEVCRVLKPGGAFIIDVPYDLFFGPHFLLFNVHCFIEGYLKGNDLYKQRCGHINHFTRRTVVRLLKTQNLSIREMTFCNFLTLHAAAVKDD